MTLLAIQDLAVDFATRRGTVAAVRGIDLSLSRGETVGVVGESGSGKSVSAYAVLQILDPSAAISRGSISFDSTNLLDLPEKQLQDIRGRDIAMIFQNPRASLNPIRKVGHQLEDVLRRHNRAAGEGLADVAVQLLDTVQIRHPERRYHAYPFELSGGQCQRILIAMALACQPQLMIADEPTTGLDVTTQKAIMELLSDLARRRSMATILITHDLALAAEYCNQLVVMKDGEIIERGTPAELLHSPKDPYTARLVQATPGSGATQGVRPLRSLIGSSAPDPVRRVSNETLLEVSGLRKVFGSGDKAVVAVDSIDFTIMRGETVGLVGESGSGKSTVSHLISRLDDPTAGQLTLDGQNMLDVPSRRFARDPRRADIQMVFQDATDSLNPRFTAFDAIADPVRRLTHDNPAQRVPELAEQVGLPSALLTRFAHQLSGGQKARVGIARALASRPRLLILDEPTAALDVSIQAIVLNLLAELRATLDISYLFISHDLQVVAMLCDRVLVMQAGRIVEAGDIGTVLQDPQHAYTRKLLDSAPRPVTSPSGSC